MKRAGRKILSIGCVIVLFAGLACGCGPRESPPTTNEYWAKEERINNMFDDFFAYVKIADRDRMSSYFEDRSGAAKVIEGAFENAGQKAFENWCKKVSAVPKVDSISDNDARVDLSITCRDKDEVLAQATEDGAFADAGKLADAIFSAPTVTKEIRVKLIYDENRGWLISSESSEEVMDILFGMLLKEDLIAPPPETTTKPNEYPISVYDSYWVDTKGQETGGYHSSDKKICLYIYTWNTYSNKEISYEYTDASGAVLYSNSFIMKNNTDWIACAWSPASPLPAGEICCHIYDTNGDLVHISTVGIYADDAKIPYPITWLSTSHWIGADGLAVTEYFTDTTLISYEGDALKFYKDLNLHYRFVDAEGQVLFEGDQAVTDQTEIFTFSYVPEVPFEEETTVTLLVTTSDETPFLTAEIPIVMPMTDTEAENNEEV